MRLYFIRHAQSANNALWDANGSERGRVEDPELTKTGKHQAQLLGEYIRRMDAEAGPNAATCKRDGFALTHLYTSLMVRAVDTAHAVADAAQITPTAWPDIHETGGIFLEDPESGERVGRPGNGRSFFASRFPRLLLPEALDDTGWWNRPFEEDELRPQRAARVLQALLERHSGTTDRVALVSHGAFYMHLMRAIFGIQSGNIWYLMYNTGITRIDFRSTGEAVLVYHNRTEHLTESLLT